MKKLYIFIALLTFSTNSNAVSRFDPILKEIIKYQEFEMDATKDKNKLLNTEKFINFETHPLKKQVYNFKKISKSEDLINDDFIQTLFKATLSLINNELEPEIFLELLLKNRLKKNYEKYKELENIFETKIAPVPEDIYLFNKCDHYDIELAKNLRIKSIEGYQLKVRLIKRLFQIIPINELTKKSISLLRASPSLWDILQNKTTNLGHRDQSGGYIKVITYMDCFKCDLSDALSKIEDGILCKKWEKNKKNYDVYLYESHFIPKKKFIESKMLGADGSGISCILTDYENGECDDLPYPDFLKFQPEKPFIEFPNFFDTFDFNLLSDEVDVHEEIKSQSDKKSIESEDNNNDIIHIEQIDPVNDKSENIIDNPEPNINNNIISDNIKNEIADDVDYLPPSGIRKFHNLMPEAPYPLLNLKKKDQRFVDKIFNSKTSHTISYGEFRTFWQKMNGKIIEDTGSSHKQLIGPKGDPLYGIFAHNDAHTYGKNTIKYFRAALYYIGCRPS